MEDRARMGWTIPFVLGRASARDWRHMLMMSGPQLAVTSTLAFSPQRLSQGGKRQRQASSWWGVEWRAQLLADAYESMRSSGTARRLVPTPNCQCAPTHTFKLSCAQSRSETCPATWAAQSGASDCPSVAVAVRRQLVCSPASSWSSRSSINAEGGIVWGLGCRTA